MAGSRIDELEELLALVAPMIRSLAYIDDMNRLLAISNLPLYI